MRATKCLFHFLFAKRFRSCQIGLIKSDNLIIIKFIKFTNLIIIGLLSNRVQHSIMCVDQSSCISVVRGLFEQVQEVFQSFRSFHVDEILTSHLGYEILQESLSLLLLSSLLSSLLRREDAELRDDEDDVRFFLHVTWLNKRLYFTTRYV